MHNRAANAYRRVYLESATPTRMLDELYARLLRDCARARAAILARDATGKGREIAHALQILEVLGSSLDGSAAPELVARIAALYRFCGDRLTAASVAFDAAPLAEVERIVTTLRESFAAAGGGP